MTKLTIDSYKFDECLQNHIMNCRPNAHKELIDYIDAKLAEAYEQGKKDGVQFMINGRKIKLGDEAT